MKVAGFTFIRNALKFDYPVVEAIRSILPICDEVVVAVGDSEDGTRALIESIDKDKIRIIDTVWDDSLRAGGQVLAVETDKAFAAVASDSDWAFYIQGDEVMHERYLDVVRNAMQQYKDDTQIDGLLFNYAHFYGSYDYVADSRDWYRKEIRVIRNDKNIRSYRDAQGFRKSDNSKLRVKPIEAWMYHYGWVKHPKQQSAKAQNFNRYWHDDQWVEKNISKEELFDYSAIKSLKHFEDTHPRVMQARIEQKNWFFAFDPTKKRLPLKHRLSNFIEKYTGYRIGEYKNYIVV
ncbi:MAG: glycosyltransferase family 2 protein [Gammaproteobacteria bacterium]|nr:glycosyltransferase family 2 protein [Gammaproteobacteria bacterium]